jgi:hypothetical protein
MIFPKALARALIHGKDPADNGFAVRSAEEVECASSKAFWR